MSSIPYTTRDTFILIITFQESISEFFFYPDRYTCIYNIETLSDEKLNSQAKYRKTFLVSPDDFVFYFLFVAILQLFYG